MAVQQIKRSLDATQHAKRQHINLHDSKVVDVILIPLDEGPVLHRTFGDRNGLVQAALS